MRFLKELAWIWIGRQKGIDEKEVHDRGVACGFNEAQIKFINVWINKKIVLVAK
jgi:hypothetical protein